MTDKQSNGWVRSSYSSNGGNCVEVRPGLGAVDVRDSKNPEGGHFTVTAGSWSAFVAGIRAGEFDR